MTEEGPNRLDLGVEVVSLPYDVSYSWSFCTDAQKQDVLNSGKDDEDPIEVLTRECRNVSGDQIKAFDEAAKALIDAGWTPVDIGPGFQAFSKIVKGKVINLGFVIIPVSAEIINNRNEFFVAFVTLRSTSE